ncbi:VOC family protein [Streptomyces sp. B-S-A8]|uniref:VOC family protein n=1 Tax=Streptomyces solicavernae TaxID=3043614 RepID=A0ABT6RZS4_9ACTN|nr:VOC family protein [Streptomyces sp. B-S-A8]MDI3389944.1 VOC family protein [Streptomyces sp. B-S-A8]
MATPQKIKTCLWYDGRAQEAAEFYTSLFDDSRVTEVQRYGEAGPGEPGSVMVVLFELAGTPFMGLNGGPEFTFSEACSVAVDCEDQKEVDRLWSALTADGGAEGPCGWLKDKYGLSWQIVPRALDELLADPDPARAARAMKAMLGMGKLDVQALTDAADGK